jgi:hypothetical protein
MQSGLFRLVYTLIARMYRALGQNPNALVQYVTNNADIWDFPKVPNELAQTAEIEGERWLEYMTSLDTAILSLLGEEDIPIADLAARLDASLSSSLWTRSLAREKNDAIRDLLKTTLHKRAAYIWNRSTPIGRRSYFLAGVGLDTGLRLDAIAQEAAALLIEANGAILIGDEARAVEAFTKFADLIFQVSPFTPDHLPPNWKDVLEAWLTGKPLADVAAGNEAEVLRFVEEALVYRLPWGMEAIRVRGLAVNDYKDDNGFTLSDFELSRAAPALETGTLSIPAAILMQAGFASRLAAISVIQQTEAKFDSPSEMRQWLRSKQITTLTADPNWPTPETAEMWNGFIGSLRRSATRAWKHRPYTVELAPGEHGIANGQALRIGFEDGGILLDAAYNEVGRLKEPVNAARVGLLMVTASLPKIRLDYYGPDDLYDDDEFAAILG